MLIPSENVERSILLLRGQKVMLDADLAALYGVETKELVRAVKRNLKRFPDDFMFQLTAEEFAALRFQSGTSKGRGGRRYRPYVFTEHGVAMLSSVLHSERAIQANIVIMRAFARLRAPARTPRDAPGPLLPPRRARKQVRRPLPSGLRRHPRLDASARDVEPPDRLLGIAATAQEVIPSC